MAVLHKRTLPQLRNTRDLRAEILALAADLLGSRLQGRLDVVAPVISESTVRQEWDRLLPAIAPTVRSRMSLAVEHAGGIVAEETAGYAGATDAVPLNRPNYRFEVLRLLLAGGLDRSPSSFRHLLKGIGASQTPIRAALSALKAADLVHTQGRSLCVIADDLSLERLAQIRALPQTTRFRFARGAHIRPPAQLLERAALLLGSSSPTDWRSLALSGAAAAHVDAPSLDLLGMPRLDLVAHAPRDAKGLDTRFVHRLDDGLEQEPNVLAPAPVVVTLVRADDPAFRHAAPAGPRLANRADVFLSLLDMGLRSQALQYARALRA